MKWENPPPRGINPEALRTRWRAEAAMLRERPGEWAVLAQFRSDERLKAYSMAHNISTGRLGAFLPSGAFQGAARASEDKKTVKVYARYLKQENADSGPRGESGEGR